MSVERPGPEPDDAPALDDGGGGVQPGDTPPDAGQTSGGLSHPQPMPGRTVPILAFIVVGLLVLAVAAFFVARVFALFD